MASSALLHLAFTLTSQTVREVSRGAKTAVPASAWDQPCQPGRSRSGVLWLTHRQGARRPTVAARPARHPTGRRAPWLNHDSPRRRHPLVEAGPFASVRTVTAAPASASGRSDHRVRRPARTQHDARNPDRMFATPRAKAMFGSALGGDASGRSAHAFCTACKNEQIFVSNWEDTEWADGAMEAVPMHIPELNESLN